MGGGCRLQRNDELIIGWQCHHQRSTVMHNEIDQSASPTCGPWQNAWRIVLIVITIFLGCLAVRLWLHFFQARTDDIKMLYLLRCNLDEFFGMMPKLDWFMCLENSKLSGKSLYGVGAHFYTQLAIPGVVLIARAQWRPIIYILCFLMIIIAAFIMGVGCIAALLMGDFLPSAVFGIIFANAAGNFYLVKRKFKSLTKE